MEGYFMDTLVCWAMLFIHRDSWQNGSILYDGTWYHNISLMYDIYKDEVLIRCIPIHILFGYLVKGYKNFITRIKSFVRLYAG